MVLIHERKKAMNKSGYILVEVMMAVLLGSLMLGVLFQSLSQTNTLFGKVVGLSSIERAAVLVQQQFETDFSGMIAPQIVEKKEEGQESSSLDKDKKPDEKKADTSKEKKEEPFKSFSFETGDKGTVKIISFVTTNPLLTYKQPCPRIVRVAYRVVADPQHQGSFQLLRQQSEELFLKRFEAACKKETIKPGQQLIRSYELASHIQLIVFEFFVEKIEKKEEEASGKKPEDNSKKDKKKELEEKKRVFVLIDDWLKLSDDEKKKYEPQALPAFGHCTMILLDEKSKPKTFEFWFAPKYDMLPVVINGITDLPTLQEEQGRQAAAQQEKQFAMHDGIPQPVNQLQKNPVMQKGVLKPEILQRIGGAR